MKRKDLIVACLLACVFALTIFLSASMSPKKMSAEEELTKHNRIVSEANRRLALTPAQRDREDCGIAESKFKACSSRTGSDYIDCVANIKNIPNGCGGVSLRDISDRVNSK